MFFPLSRIPLLNIFFFTLCKLNVPINPKQKKKIHSISYPNRKWQTNRKCTVLSLRSLEPSSGEPFTVVTFSVPRSSLASSRWLCILLIHHTRTANWNLLPLQANSEVTAEELNFIQLKAASEGALQNVSDYIGTKKEDTPAGGKVLGPDTRVTVL